jgi:hypothetical protein
MLLAHSGAVTALGIEKTPTRFSIL